MDFVALLGLFKDWGPSAISSGLVIVVLYLIKRVNKSCEDNNERAQSFQIQIDTRLKDLRDDTAKVLDEHSRRISHIELEYVRRETFYRELGGWKDDINRLHDKMSDFNTSVIELWKHRKD